MDIRFCIKDNMKKLPFIDKLTDAENSWFISVHQ